jgi:hypothetical protein
MTTRDSRVLSRAFARGYGVCGRAVHEAGRPARARAGDRSRLLALRMRARVEGSAAPASLFLLGGIELRRPAQVFPMLVPVMRHGFFTVARGQARGTCAYDLFSTTLIALDSGTGSGRRTAAKPLTTRWTQ